LKQRLISEGSEVVTFCHGLKLTAPDGKKRETDCANTEGILRVIQSVPSPTAEPFKLWLARIGKERIDEIENPELGMDRVKRSIDNVFVYPISSTACFFKYNGIK
jgi:DNA-damage-inducible protein D